MSINNFFKIFQRFALIKLIFVLSISTFFTIYVAAQQNDPPQDSRFYERQASKAYQAKDLACFLENMKQAERLRPNYPRIVYNLAVAYAVNGKTDEAISQLNRLAAMKLVYQIEKDDDFASIKETEEFQEAVKKFQANAQPVGSGKEALTVREKGLVVEGIAYDATAKTFYLGSVAGRKILSVDARGNSKIFADQTSAGLWSVFGMKIDAKRRILWATTAAHQQMPGLQAGEDGQTGIFAFDLKTGKLIKKYFISDKTHPHLFGDLAIAANGDVYATDSRSPGIYLIRSGKTQIETFLESADFASLQGLDFSSDGKFLFVADYNKGVFKIDLAAKDAKILAAPENALMYFLDGIYFDGNSLIGIQNGSSPQRVVRLELSKDMNEIERYEILEINNPVFDDITLGTLVGKDFYFIADSQWDALGDDGKFAAPDNLKDLVVFKTRIK